MQWRVNVQCYYAEIARMLNSDTLFSLFCLSFLLRASVGVDIFMLYQQVTVLWERGHICVYDVPFSAYSELVCYACMRGILTTIKNIQIFIGCVRANGTRACSKNRTEILPFKLSGFSDQKSSLSCYGIAVYSIPAV